MDYNAPKDAQNCITLGMVRIKSNNSQPLGNLIVNPGGPGYSPVSAFVLQQQDALVSENLIKHYNIIAPDPRGVGLSNPVQCNASLYNQRVPSYIANAQDFDNLVAHNQALGESCTQMTGPAINFLDTVSVAKDLDQIRQALGDEKLDFLGVSYGTFLGSQYAELFPQRVGRMVLDGILGHSQSDADAMLTEATTFEAMFNSFARLCYTAPECAFYQQDLPSIFDQMVDEANEQPIPAPGCLVPADAATRNENSQACRSDVTGYELISSTQGLMSSLIPWPAISQALKEAYEGNATLLSSTLVTSNVPPIDQDYNPFAHIAISCQDWVRGTGPRAAADLMAKLIAARALAPHTRGVTEMLNIQTSCLGWPAPLVNPQRLFNQKQLAQAPPILLVNAFQDPSTSIAWALGVREQMPTAVSIFRSGYGHISYWHYGDTQKAIDGFLLDGEMPADLAIFES
ncbi:hypothetical protein CDD81_1483 [Ophiocordyceps australis]|uniref:AB hydrolase-1 domain-containing protein n=1 Tax=Ophiocordyceps australis TaxID=1399860 RepID=A0A2C5YDH5_9HYPO|nr:hypothetical protein CDD81_1483 [Ophiocordyceps australis]